MKINNKAINETLALLTTKELKDICKARGFEISSKSNKADLIEFLSLRISSTTGVKAAIDLLSSEDKLILHLLKSQNEEFNVGKFDGIFNINGRQITEAKIAREIFLLLKEKFITKGILLVYEKFCSCSGGKYGKYAAFFPEEFHSQFIFSAPKDKLTPLSFSITRFEETILEKINSDLLDVHSTTKIKAPNFSINEKSICFSSAKIHSLAGVRSHLFSHWLKKNLVGRSWELGVLNIPPLKLRKIIVDLCPPGHGISVDYLFGLFEKFRVKVPDKDKKTFLNYAVNSGIAVLDKAGKYISFLQDDLNTSDFYKDDLNESNGKIFIKPGIDCNIDALLKVSKFTDVEKCGLDIFVLKPNLIKVSKVSENNPFFNEFLKRSALIRKINESVINKKNKIKIHSNLVVIQLNGIDVQSYLTAKHPNKIHELGNGFYAVANDDLDLIKKTGKSRNFIAKEKGIL